jgi:putative SOS response-associated peptidase YedK
MCSQYEISIPSSSLRNYVSFPAGQEDLVIQERLLPYQLAPVIVLQNDQLKLTKMQFSLVPHWSKEPKVKFATHNARIETVQEKPTWKKPFLSQHCVIPLTQFFESVYEGPHAGHIIRFVEENNALMFAMGLFDFWENPNPQDGLKNFFSFSILTTEPSQFILENGHDRSPIFMDPKFMKEWCQLKSTSFDEVKKKVQEFAISPALKVSKERALKAGWEKRK